MGFKIGKFNIGLDDVITTAAGGVVLTGLLNSTSVGDKIQTGAAELINGPETDRGPENLLAQISREQFDAFNRLYRPIEEDLANDVKDPEIVAEGVRRATGLVGTGFDAARSAGERTRSRLGVTQTDQRKERLGLQSSRSQALETVGAQNIVRSGTVDRQRSTQADLVASGRGLSASAASAAGTAANLATNRRIATSQAEAARTSGIITTTATGAGIGFAVGGPPGAVIGGGIGLLAGVLA